MYQIFARSSFFRPYFVDGIEIADIRFFTETGTMISAGHGFLEGTNGSDLNPFLVEKYPILKRKAQFSGMYAEHQTFYIKEILKDRCDKKGYVLYVPHIASEWEIRTETFDYNTRRSFNKIHTNTVQAFKINQYLGAEDIPENVSFVEKVTRIGKPMCVSEHDLSDHMILKNRDAIITEIKAFNE